MNNNSDFIKYVIDKKWYIEWCFRWKSDSLKENENKENNNLNSLTNERKLLNLITIRFDINNCNLKDILLNNYESEDLELESLN